MQSLESPFPVIDGYALLPDHADKRLWYALPSAPRLGIESGHPQLSIIEYLGGGVGADKAAGALLQLTTELTIPQTDLDSLAGRLPGKIPNLPSGVQVVPVPFDAGSVELAVLGRTAAPLPAGSAAPGGPFEVVFSAGGKPSLGGRNEASFQLVLNAAAAEMLAKSLDQPELPVMVTYVMTFAALRPSFSLDIKADWTKVYSSLRNQFSANAWIAAADVDVAVTRALEESGVNVDLVITGGEGSQASAQKTRDKLLDWVLERLFQPMSPPASQASTIGQVVGDAVWSLSRAILPGVAYRLKVVDEQQLRHMDIRATETLAENRELRPQGTLGGLLNNLRVDEKGNERTTWKMLREGMIERINLDGFPRVEVGVDVVDRFRTDGLKAVRVDIARQLTTGERADETELAFTGPGQHQDFVVNLLEDQARGAAMDTLCTYRTLVDFAPDSPLIGHHPSVMSDWKPYHATTLVADPREAYTVADVTVTVAPLFSFTLFPAVTVELISGIENGTGSGAEAGLATRVQLDANNPLQHWVFATDAATAGYRYRPTYHRPLTAGGDVVGEWQSAVEPWLSLPDPMPEKLDVAFFVDLPWADITSALLQVFYEDKEHSIRYERETITLGQDSAVVRRTYSIAAGGTRAVKYRLTIKLARGGLLEGSWREAADDRIIIDRRLVDERQVLLRVIGGTLAEQNLREARVTLQVRDPATADVRASTDIRVQAGHEVGFSAPFSYLAGDPPVKEVFYQVSLIDTNGFVARQPWTSTSAELLVLNLRTKTIQ
jgi:hypothetical protein